ncbi:MAG TPA: hypothetical protein ENH96_05050 [Chlamydiae bacterium]|nr:hypothetical protein [Chlamydiota bacterium]
MLTNIIKNALISIKKAKVFLFILSFFILNSKAIFAFEVPADGTLEDGINAANSVAEQININAGVTLSAPLPVIIGTYVINGNSNTLTGSSAHRGFIILGSGNSPTIQDITITSTIADGGDGGNSFQDDGGSGGGGLGAGGAIYVGDSASVTLSNITYTTNNATGGNAGTVGAAGISGGAGGGGLGGNAANATGDDGTGGGGALEGEDASGSTGGGTSPYAGGNGATTGADGSAAGYGGGGGGAANTATVRAPGAGGFGGGGGAGAGPSGNENAANAGFGAGGGGGGVASGTAGTSPFGGGDGAAGGATVAGQGGGGAALGGSIFIDSTSTATIIEATSYPFTTTNTLTAGTGNGSPSTLGNHIFLASAGNLSINAAGTFTLTQAIEADSINSTGGIEVLGGGIVNLSGTSPAHLVNTFRGDLTITAGTVQYDAAVSLGNGTGITFPSAGAASTKVLEDTWSISVTISNPITMTGDGTLKRNFASFAHNMRLTSAIVGSGRITVIGVGSIRPQAASPSFSGGWNIDGQSVSTSGNLVFDSPGTLGTGSIQIRNGNYSAAANLGGMLMYKGTGNNSLSNNIELPLGDGTIVFGESNSALTLSGIISGVGNLTFDQTGTTGSCLLTNNSNSYSGTTTILDGTVHSNVADAISNSSSITITSPGQLQINTVSQTIKNFSGTGNLILNQGSSNTLTVNQTSALTHSGDISGSGKFNKDGASTLTFTAAKTYTGGTTLTAGTLEFDNAIADVIKASTSVTINGGTLDILTSSADQEINELSGSGGTIDINNKILTINNATGVGGTFSGVIINTTGPGNIIKIGANTLTLGGTNTYTGTTAINAGNITLPSTGDISSSSSVTLNNAASSFILALEGTPFSQTIQTLSDDASGTTINLNDNTLVIDQSALGTTYSGVISGTGSNASITKSTGTFELKFAGVNTYGGTTTVNAGTLSLTTAGSITSSSLTVNTGGTFNIETGPANKTVQTLSGTGGSITTNNNRLTITQGAGGGTYSGVISGSGNASGESIIKEGSGTLTLNNTNTYTGSTTINTGILDLEASGNIATSSAVTVTSPGQLQISAGTKTINDFSGTGNLILNNTGDTFTVDQTTTPLTHSGVISGTGKFAKAGAATNLFLEGANTFSGTTTVTAGTLTLRDTGAIASSTELILNTGAFEIVTTGSSLSKTVGALSGSGNIDLNENILTVNQGALKTYTGIISNSILGGSFVKEGSFKLNFGAAGAHTYTGTTTISGNELDLTTAGSSIVTSSELILSGGTFSITGGAKSIKILSGASGAIDLKTFVLSIDQTAVRSYLGTFTDAAITSGITKDGSSNLTLGGDSSAGYSGNTIINAGKLILNDAGDISNGATLTITSPGIFALETATPTTKGINQLSGTGNIELNTNSLTITQGTGPTSYSGIISGTGGIEKAGANNLTFDNATTAHSYTGGTTISNGSLILDTAASSIATSSSVALTAGSASLTVTAAVGAKAIQTLSGSGSINLNGNDLTITQGSDQTLSGVIGGASSAIIKAGSSKLTLSGTNTYTGATTISAGILELSTGTGSISASSSVAISTSGASLDIASSAGTKTIKTLSGASGTNINLNNNDLTINQSSLLPAYAGIITGVSGGIIKDASSANLILGGANTYAGPTSITGTGGKLILNDTGTISDSSSLTIISPGIFAIETSTSTAKSIKTLSTSDGNIELNTNPLTITQGSNATYSGIISSSTSTGGITKAGTSKLTLSGANTYTGPTNIIAGTLTLDPTGSIDASSTVTITSPGILEANNGATSKDLNNLNGTGNIEFPIDSLLSISLITSTTFSGNIDDSGSNFGEITVNTLGATDVFTLSGTNSFKQIAKDGDGVLSVSSDSNLPNTLIDLQGGTFRATETFTTSTPFSITVAGNKAIEVLTDKTLTLSGSITASKDVSKTGAGTLSINSANVGNTGVTTVAAGTMLIKPAASWSATTFNISSGASLTGTGTVDAVVTNAGTISPGESIGTIIIDGAYTENGTLEIEITGAPTNLSDKVEVIGIPGTATLNPATSTLSVIPLSSTEFFLEGTEYVIITSTGLRTGTFGTVIDTDPRLAFTVRYETNRVVLIMSDSALFLPINDIINPNAKAVAEYLGSCNFSNPDFVSILVSLSSLNLENLTDALLQISPARFGALQLTNYTNDQTVSKILTDRLRKLYRCNKACKDNRDEPCLKPKTYEFWVEPFSYFTHQRNLEDQRPFKNKVFGTIMGTDFNFSNKINFGGAGGYSYGDIDWRGNLGYAKIHSAYGSLYASNYNHFGFINASVIATGNFYDTKRKIRFADVDRKAKGKHKGFDITTHLGGGLDFLMADDFYFQPTLDVDYTYVWHDGFKERGADSLNLIVDTSNFSRVRGAALLNFIKDIKLTNLCISPALRAGYAYEDELSSAKITSRLEGVSCTKNKFTVQAFHKNHSKGIVGANITGTQTDGFTFYVNYQFEFGHKFHQHLGSARFEWNF